jgi:hypothetical protein
MTSSKNTIRVGLTVIALVARLTWSPTSAVAGSAWTLGKFEENTNSNGVDLGRYFVFSKTSIKGSSGLIEKVKRVGLSNGTEAYSTSGKSIKALLKADQIQFQTLAVTAESVPSSLKGGFCGKQATRYLVLADFGDGELTVAAFSAKPGPKGRDADLCGTYSFVKSP